MPQREIVDCRYHVDSMSMLSAQAQPTRPSGHCNFVQLRVTWYSSVVICHPSVHSCLHHAREARVWPRPSYFEPLDATGQSHHRYHHPHIYQFLILTGRHESANKNNFLYFYLAITLQLLDRFASGETYTHRPLKQHIENIRKPTRKHDHPRLPCVLT